MTITRDQIEIMRQWQRQKNTRLNFIAYCWAALRRGLWSLN